MVKHDYSAIITLLTVQGDVIITLLTVQGDNYPPHRSEVFSKRIETHGPLIMEIRYTEVVHCNIIILGKY